MNNYYYEVSKKNFNMMGPNTLRLLEEQLTNVPEIKKGLRVLDLGCGKGLNSLYFAKENEACVFAADLWISASDNYKRFKEWGMENNIIPIHADATDLPFSNEYFDILISIDAYHYFGKSDGFFEGKILSLIKPGGYVMIAIPGIKQEFEDNLPELMNEWCQDEIEDFHSIAWWKALIGKSHGIETISVDEMKCFDSAWQDWFDTKHEYAIRDKEFMDKGLRKNLNFISIIVKKQDKSVS
jgi:cyclopropane fatty-acyl-phospholipid synthase-like methyltransferase